MLKLGIAIAAVLVAVVIVYGALQADDEFNGGEATPTATPLATTTILRWLGGTTTLDSWPTPTPPAIVPLPGSGVLFQVRGGDNPCRYLYTSNRVGTFAWGEIVLEFAAGTHDMGLAATGEMDLYGDTGPHLFEIEDTDGTVILTVPVDRGATVHQTVVFPGAGLYKLYDRLFDEPVHVSEITARPIGQPGSIAVTDWCPPEASAP